jgi:hypothetical protein
MGRIVSVHLASMRDTVPANSTGAAARTPGPKMPIFDATMQFKGSDSWQSLGLTGHEVIDVIPDAELTPQSDATLRITRAEGSTRDVTLTLRVDTPIGVDYYRVGGILPFVLRQLLA